MRIFLIILFILHGLIHLLGFVKAYSLSEVKQLTEPISKTMGLVWLLAALLFVVSGLLFAFKTSYWWLFGFMALVVSQVLILNSWNDAKFGTLPNVILLIVCIIGYSTWNYYNKYQSDVINGLEQTKPINNELLTEDDLVHLPEPVKKYLRYTGSVGQPKVKNFNIVFKGSIRKNEASEWMPFTSEQYNFMEAPTRLFFMNAVMKHLPVAGYHAYKNGKAFMDIRLFSLFKVQYQDGEVMNQAETVTFFNDMCCLAPPTLIDQRITWEDKGNNQVQASFTNGDITIMADLFFNDAGQLINFKSNDRYNADAGKRLPWSTPLKDYKEINGYTLASYADAIYTYPEGDVCYGTFESTSVKYNVDDLDN